MWAERAVIKTFLAGEDRTLAVWRRVVRETGVSLKSRICLSTERGGEWGGGVPQTFHFIMKPRGEGEGGRERERERMKDRVSTLFFRGT